MNQAAWALTFVVVAVPPLHAQEFTHAGRQLVIALGGGDIGGTSIHGLAAGWTMKRPYVNVSIAAHLSNGGGPDGYAGGTAYLTRKIGPHSRSRDEVAKKEFELPGNFNGMFPLFEGLDLAAGEYWLVLEAPKNGRFSFANWVVSMPASISTTGATGFLGTTTYLDADDVSDYMPATSFRVSDQRYGYQFHVSGEPVPLLKDEDPGRATLSTSSTFNSPATQ